jgi:hypothetical protein
MLRDEKVISPRFRLSRHCVLVLCFVFGSLLPIFEACPAESVSLQVIVVHASHSGSGFDKRLNFARRNLQAYGYKNYTYAWSRTFTLAGDKAEKFSVAPGISALITLKGVLEQSNRVQYSLTVYNRNKQQAGAIYTIPRNGMGVAVVPQSQDVAYIIIVRPLK